MMHTVVSSVALALILSLGSVLFCAFVLNCTKVPSDETEDKDSDL